MAKKISEFTEGTDMKETDIIPYVDLENQTTKKITYENFFKRKDNNIYTMQYGNVTIDTETTITIPAYYKKGAGVLQVYLEGSLLINGTHYYEGAKDVVTEDGEIINTITLTGWGKISQEYNFIFVIQGTYEAPATN